jgi:hypothetical protein
MQFVDDEAGLKDVTLKGFIASMQAPACMEELEIVEVEGVHLATIIRTKKSPSGSKFYTPDSSQFQVGVHSKEKGTHTKAHYYTKGKVEIERPVQEIFYIESGRLRMTMYDAQNRRVVAERELGPGDLMILAGVTAHGVDFLEDTRLVEIKQGPFQADKKVTVE